VDPSDPEPAGEPPGPSDMADADQLRAALLALVGAGRVVLDAVEDLVSRPGAAEALVAGLSGLLGHAGRFLADTAPGAAPPAPTVEDIEVR
jgi:hypothetical protein